MTSRVFNAAQHIYTACGNAVSTELSRGVSFALRIKNAEHFKLFVGFFGCFGCFTDRNQELDADSGNVVDPPDQQSRPSDAREEIFDVGTPG